MSLGIERYKASRPIQAYVMSKNGAGRNAMFKVKIHNDHNGRALLPCIFMLITFFHQDKYKKYVKACISQLRENTR